MPLHIQYRLSDQQLAAIDAAAQIVDERTGIRTVLSRQQVLLSILDAWIDQHAQSVSTSEAGEATERAAPSLPDSPLDGHKETDREPPTGDSRRGLQTSDRQALAERVRALRKTMGYDAITRLLNTERVPTFSGKPGAQWSNSSLARLEKFRG